MPQRQFKSSDTDPWIYGFGDGHDGDLTISTGTAYSGANGSCSGSAASTSLTLGAAGSFTNGMLVLIHQTTGTGVSAWELNKIASGGGTTSLTMAHVLMSTYTDSGASQAQILELRQYGNVTVNNSQVFTAPAWDGDKGGWIAFLASGTVTVNGVITAGGKGYRGGNSNCFTGVQGEGYAGTGTDSNAANTTGGGGGKGNNHASDFKPNGGGGGGGHATSGTDGNQPGDQSTHGIGGGTIGSASLTSIYFGGGGGGAATPNDGGWWCQASFMPGVPGGGGVLIIGSAITVSGVGAGITCGGAASAAKVDSKMGYGGAGAGGSILLKGKSISLGSSIVTALAGGVGAAGGVGRIHVDYKDSLSGTTSPTLDSSQDASLDYMRREDSYTLLL